MPDVRARGWTGTELGAALRDLARLIKTTAAWPRPPATGTGNAMLLLGRGPLTGPAGIASP